MSVAEVVRRLAIKSGLAPEAVSDLAPDTLNVAVERLALSPITLQAVGLGTARRRNVDPEARSAAMQRAVQVRWAKHRKTTPKSDD